MSSRRVFIIGAGASNGASYVHPKYKPPLTPDLIKIFDNCSLNNKLDGQHVERWFKELLHITNSENDIENFFTIFFSLEVISSLINPAFAFLSRDQIQDMLQRFDEIEKKYQRTAIEIFRPILQFFLENPRAAVLANPNNLKTIFSECLREYFMVAITDCNCKYHSLLFSKLTSDDAVVSFNYDSICDFTLYRLGKLDKNSFEGLGFDNIVILNDCEKKESVKFLHIHGSFNWWTTLDDKGSHGINYCLLNEDCKTNLIGNSPFPVILPFKQKKILYESMPIYKRHVDGFLSLIEEATEIFIVGKTFDNSDEELNDLICEKSKKIKKQLFIIDHNFQKPNFIKKHEKIFNACYVRGWRDLEHYYNQNQ